MVSVFILVLAVAGAVFWLANKNKKLPFGALEVLANDGVVLEVIQGQVKITIAGREKVLFAPASQEITKGAKIETLAGGRANIIFPSGSVARLDSATSVDLSDYQSLERNIKVKIYLSSGNLWSRVQRLLDVDSEYEVKTSNTVAVVRGTSFNISRLDDQTRVDVLSNKVSIAAIDSQSGQVLPGGQIDIEAGKFVKVDSANLPSEQKPLVSEVISPQDLQQPWYRENLDSDKKIDGALANFGDNISRNRLKEILSAVVSLNIKTTTKEDLLKNEPLVTQIFVSPSVVPSVSASPTASPGAINRTIESPSPSLRSSASSLLTPVVEDKLSLTNVWPVSAPGNGYQYTRLTLKGGGFSSGCRAFLGSHALEKMQLISPSILEGTLGADIAPEVYDISVSCGGQKVVLPKSFNVYQPKE